MDLNKKPRNKTIPLAIAFSVIYILFSFKPIGTELTLTPEWTENILNIHEASEKDGELIPFRLGQNFGYFTDSGKISTCKSYPFKSTITSTRYTSYGANTTEFDMYLPNGKKEGTIKEAGFPFFDEDRIYVFLPGGTSFSQFNEKGKQLWRYESYLPVTAFASNSSGCVAGFSDGRLISFNKNGKPDQNFIPGGSDINVILGVDLSEDAKTIACVCGQNEQRFIVASNKDGHSKIIFHKYLEKQLARQTLVKFSPDSKTVYYNYNGGLGIVNLETGRTSEIPIEGKISQIEFSSTSGMVFALSKDKNTYLVSIIEPFDHTLACFDFEGSNGFIMVRGDSLYVGRDTNISKLTVSRK